MGDDSSEDSTKDAILASDLHKALREEHKALQTWLIDTLDDHRRLLQEQGQSLQALLELQSPPSPITPHSAPVARRVKSIQTLPNRRRADDFNNPGRRVDDINTTSTTSGMVLDLRRSSKTSQPARVAEPVPEISCTASSNGEWRAITPTVPTAPSLPPSGLSLNVVVPVSDPIMLEAAEKDQNESEDDLHPFAVGTEHVATHHSFVSFYNDTDDFPRQTSHMKDYEAEQERAEWNKHLQKRVSEQLDGKKLRRSGSVTSAVGDRPYSTLRLPSSRRIDSIRTKLRTLAQSTTFQWVCAGVIVLNVAFIGYTTNQGMENILATPPQQDPDWFTAANTVFTVWYCLELALRIVAFGWDFVTNQQDKKWNAFDSILVFLSLVEEIVQDVDVGIGALRVIRGLRMFRVLRIIRVMRYFRDLRLMVCSILQSLGSLSWALLLLVTIMYLFSVVFMQGATLHLLTQAELGETPGGVIKVGVETWYSSVFSTMYTLLASIVNGVGWVDVVRPLEEISMVYRLLFAFYIVFVVIGVLNVLTGIFVERACELSGLDKDLVIQTQMKRNETFLVEMKRIFEEADADNSGSITWEEFKEYLENDRVKAYLSTQQLDAFDARMLFDILTEGETPELSIEQFIVGCQRLRGQARSVDLVAVLQESRAVNKRIKAVMRHLEGGHSGMPTPSMANLRRTSTVRLSQSTE